MPGLALLAPIPAVHLDDAIEVLATKEFVLFGSGAFDVFQKAEHGCLVYIYRSHENADPTVTYKAKYFGIVGEPLTMRKLERDGYRPRSTHGEKWPFYWKVSDIVALEKPMPLSDIQLASGSYLQGYPHGPMFVVS